MTTQIVGALLLLLAVLVGVRVRRQIPGWFSETLDGIAKDIR